MNTRDLDRLCMRLRSVTETDDAGIKHRVNRYCRSLLKSGHMHCSRCEKEIEIEESASHSMEIQR